MEKTLFKEISGKNAVELATIKPYYPISEDGRINQFFKGIDLRKQSTKITAFLTSIFGGPSLYTERNIRKSHKSVVAMPGNVHITLNEMSVAPDLKKQILAKLEKHRDDVLYR